MPKMLKFEVPETHAQALLEALDCWNKTNGLQVAEVCVDLLRIIGTARMEAQQPETPTPAKSRKKKPQEAVK